MGIRVTYWRGSQFRFSVGLPLCSPLGLVSPPRSSELTMGFASVTAKAKAIAPGVFFPRAKTTVNEAAVECPAPNETARLCLGGPEDLWFFMSLHRESSARGKVIDKK